MEVNKSTILTVARHQRALLTVILMKFILVAVSFATMNKSGQSTKILLMAIDIALTFAVIRAVATLMSTMGNSVVVIVICCILLIVPLIGLLVLLSVNGRATKVLRAAGLRVGLMGANISDLDKEEN